MACVTGGNGPSASVEQQLKSATNAGFSLHDAITIVSIAQAESSSKIYCVNEIGATGILQFYPGSKVTQCNLNDPNPQKALDCNYQEAYRESNGGRNFCPWASYADSMCPANPPNRVASYANFLQPTYNALIGLTHGGNDPLEVAGGAIQSSTPGQLVGNAASGIGNLAGNVSSGVGNTIGNVEHSIQNLGSGVAALTAPFQLIAKFFTEPKVAFARILLFILGIFIAFEAVKHLGGSNSNLVVVGAQNADKATFGKKAAETADIA